MEESEVLHQPPLYGLFTELHIEKGEHFLHLGHRAVCHVLVPDDQHRVATVATHPVLDQCQPLWSSAANKANPLLVISWKISMSDKRTDTTIITVAHCVYTMCG